MTQKVMAELIQILKGEMNEMQTKNKDVKEREEAELQRTIKQLRDDIDKIEQRRNQLVAKIGELKEKANSCRSERVVHSNLFKKIEKELKHHEEVYKEELLKGEKLKAQLESAPDLQNSKVVRMEIRDELEGDEEEELERSETPCTYLSKLLKAPECSALKKTGGEQYTVQVSRKGSLNQQKGKDENLI